MNINSRSILPSLNTFYQETLPSLGRYGEYSVKILNSLKEGFKNPYLSSLIVGISNIFFITIAYQLASRLDRAIESKRINLPVERSFAEWIVLGSIVTGLNVGLAKSVELPFSHLTHAVIAVAVSASFFFYNRYMSRND